MDRSRGPFRVVRATAACTLNNYSSESAREPSWALWWPLGSLEPVLHANKWLMVFWFFLYKKNQIVIVLRMDPLTDQNI